MIQPAADRSEQGVSTTEPSCRFATVPPAADQRVPPGVEPSSRSPPSEGHPDVVGASELVGLSMGFDEPHTLEELPCADIAVHVGKHDLVDGVADGFDDAGQEGSSDALTLEIRKDVQLPPRPRGPPCRTSPCRRSARRSRLPTPDHRSTTGWSFRRPPPGKPGAHVLFADQRDVGRRPSLPADFQDAVKVVRAREPDVCHAGMMPRPWVGAQMVGGREKGVPSRSRGLSGTSATSAHARRAANGGSAAPRVNQSPPISRGQAGTRAHRQFRWSAARRQG